MTTWNPNQDPIHAGPTNAWTKLLAKAKAHQEALAVGGIIVIILALFVPYYLNGRARSEKDAAGVLNLGQYYLRANVDPKSGPFKSLGEKYQQCLQTFQRIVSDYPGTSSSRVARYYLAECQFSLGDYAKAFSSFDQASLDLKGSPLADQALVGRVVSLMGESQWSQAQEAALAFLSDHPGSFLAPEMKLDLSDIDLKLKQKEESRKVLKELAEASPDTDWGREAARRLKEQS
ncbi:MAG TPA: tetratricopeptide repeat protein [bacterium]|nr:tetratricopeptide repeat protein [bacterium]